MDAILLHTAEFRDEEVKIPAPWNPPRLPFPDFCLQTVLIWKPYKIKRRLPHPQTWVSFFQKRSKPWWARAWKGNFGMLPCCQLPRLQYNKKPITKKSIYQFLTGGTCKIHQSDVRMMNRNLGHDFQLFKTSSWTQDKINTRSLYSQNTTRFQQLMCVWNERWFKTAKLNN